MQDRAINSSLSTRFAFAFVGLLLAVPKSRLGSKRFVRAFLATVLSSSISLSLLVAGAVPASPHGKADRRLLVFSLTRAGNPDIYVIRADGSGLRRLTRAAGRDDTPSWSPDGTKIAFRSRRDGNEEIYVMKADGTEQHNISENPNIDRSPAWSPDGRTIAFARMANESADTYQDDIWLMDVGGGEQRPLTHRPGIDEYPVWSPEGSTIAFACTDGDILGSRNGDFEVCLMNSDGSNVRRVTNARGISIAYSWSPDSRLLAFASSRADNPSSRSSGGDLFLLNVVTSKVTQLTRGAPVDFEPAFSPDGRQIAFPSLGRRKAGADLFILTVNGRRIQQLTRFAGEVADPLWRPKQTRSPSG